MNQREKAICTSVRGIVDRYPGSVIGLSSLLLAGLALLAAGEAHAAITCGRTITAVNAAVVTGKLQQMAAGFVYDSKTVASHKPGRFVTTKTPIWFSDHKFELLDNLVEENQHANMIIVYNFQEELAELKRRYPQAKTIDSPGGIKAWNDGKVELLLIHPKSAGHGLNLQHGGCRIAFLSLPWSLELFEQTVGRLHRSGQRHDVWCYVLMANKTIDERIWAALQDKRAISDIALEELK